MDDEFIYWRHPTPVGVKVEEVSGMESRSGNVWREMAYQIYCENGKDAYREIGHFKNGAPFLFGTTTRISVTHAGHLLAVASLPKTPEADLSQFSPRTAMGIDAEKLDRSQVLKIRDRFLSDAEKEIIPADSLEANIMAWTAKEAAYKAAFCEGLDFRQGIIIESMPVLDRHINRPGEIIVLGKVHVNIPEDKGESFDLDLYSYESDGYCVTIALSPKCAKFAKR